MQNYDVAARFNRFFVYSFYGMFFQASLFVLLIGAFIVTNGKALNNTPVQISVSLLHTVYLCFMLYVYVSGLFYRFSDSGVLCSQKLLPDQGSAMRWYFILTLLVPCCPCAIALACCF